MFKGYLLNHHRRPPQPPLPPPTTATPHPKPQTLNPNSGFAAKTHEATWDRTAVLSTRAAALWLEGAFEDFPEHDAGRGGVLQLRSYYLGGFERGTAAFENEHLAF